MQIDLQHLRLWDWPQPPDGPQPHTFLVSRALEVKIMLTRMLQEETFGRDDYRELCELIIKYLGGQVLRPAQKVPEDGADHFRIRKPGALHHARFMASSIYIMKLTLLNDQLPPNLLNSDPDIPDMEQRIRRMARYIALFHGPWFLRARVPIIAPRLDMELTNHMRYYIATDRQAAEEVIKSIERHPWYLTEELVVFGLFDDDLSADVRQNMATHLHGTPRPEAFDAGKPEFPGLENGSLEYFIGPKSWLLFHLLGANGGWLRMPVEQWENDQEFQEMKSIVAKVEVVNDCAERCIKDIQEFANASRSEDQRRRIILVSNSHRVKIPEYKRNELDENQFF